MIERGTVVAVRGNKVDAVIGGSSACQGCSACSISKSGDLLLRDVADRLGVELGDEIDVLIPDGLQMKAALAVYVVPLVCLLLGYLAGFLLGGALGFDRDSAGAIVGILAATAALAGTRLAEKAVLRGGRLAPAVHAIISRGSAHASAGSDTDDI